MTMTLSSTKPHTKLRLVWHRRDLRLHDNDLYANLKQHDGDDDVKVISLFVFDEADFHPRPSTARPQDWNAVNVGPHAARILIESVQDLRQSLESIGGKLLVRQGNPVSILPELMQTLGVTEFVWHEEPGVYEIQRSAAVRHAVRAVNPHVKIRTSMQYTLYHPEDLPRGEQEWESLAHHPNRKKSKKKARRKNKKQSTESNKSPESHQHPSSAANFAADQNRFDIPNVNDHLVYIASDRWKGMPRIMGDFRRAAGERTQPRPCIAAPSRLSTPDHLPPAGKIPTLEGLYEPAKQSTLPIMGMSLSVVKDLVTEAVTRQSACGSGGRRHVGGETAALSHLANFCRHHASTAARNLACVDHHQSSHLSHSLAFGCLSPRRVVEEAEHHGEGCCWIISHMTMRDFFLYTCLATDAEFYKLKGIPVSKKAAESIVWEDWEAESTQQKWERWAMGDTGLPLVDAAMKELRLTGYCSNRVRQNVASLLTKDMRIDWRAGAEWFQFLLEDHCVGANWGNWLYFSGVGPDPKQRHFRTVSQALKYDAEGYYVKQWLPLLAEVKGDEAFLRPWDYTTDWKVPIVEPRTQYVSQDLQRLQEDGMLISATVHSTVIYP